MLRNGHSPGYTLRRRILQKTGHCGRDYTLDLVDDTSLGAYKFFRENPFTTADYAGRVGLGQHAAQKRLNAALECDRLETWKDGHKRFYRVVKLMGNDIA